MKKLLGLIFGVSFMFGMSACVESHDNDSYQESMLYGKWQEGSVYECYYDSPINFILPTGDTISVNGTTWDTSDDVDEDEAQAFNWKLNGSTLIQEHISTFAIIPKMYTITSLTSSNLSYTDDYGTGHHFTKIE